MVWSKSAGSLLMGGACALALASASQAQTRRFDVPAGELRPALGAYARQAGVQLIYRVDDLRGVRTGGVRGAIGAEAALDQILRGTGFRVRRDASGAVAIVRAGAAPQLAVPPAVQRITPPAPVFVTPDGRPYDPDEVTEVEGLVVTGSRLPNPNLSAVRPVTAVTANEIRLQGATRIEDVLNGLPQAFAGQGSEVSNGATGIATVDLRALGPSRTLVLIDGRRVVPGDPTLPVADLNFIPAQLVDRIDVVTGGASAVYGADAVAGVVNFIMIKNFEGVRLDAQYSGYQHDNRNPVARSLGGTDGVPVAPETVWDGAVLDLTAILGLSAAGGRANATVYATYRNTDPVGLGARDFAACALQEQSGANGFACNGSATTAAAHVLSEDRLAAGLAYDLIVANGSLRPYDDPSDTFNFAPYNYFQRPDERYTFGGFAHYEVNRSADAYAQLMFMDDRTRAAIAPSGIFGQSISLPCASPLLSADQIRILCTEAGLDASDAASILVLRRNVEGGNRENDLRHTAYRLVGGLRGDLGASWTYDVYGQYSTVAFNEVFRNDFSLSRTALALDVVRDPATGKLVCRSALDPRTPPILQGCAPYDIFSPAGPSQAAVDYLQTPGFARGSTTEQVISAQLTGNLAEYGLRLPWAADGVAVAIGAEYRRERLVIDYDTGFLTSDLAGQGAGPVSVAGAFDVGEIFGEIRLPIASDRAWAQELSLEAGYRHSAYSSFGAADTYKLTLNWAPSSQVRLRAGYNRAVRAPNILELFTPATVVLGLQTDPCAGPTPQFTQAQCANTGVSASQYGRVPISGAYNTLIGGNPALEAERADTWSVGFVATPGLVPGLSLTADYFDITIDNAIGQLSAEFILSTCALTGAANLCGLVRRTPGAGALFGNGGGLVQDRRLNVGFVKTTGVDLEVAYRAPLAVWGLEGIGGLDVSLLGSWLNTLETAPGLPAPRDPSVFSYDCAGLYGAGVCGPPNPKWRHRLRLTWTTPVQGLSVSAAWRYFGGVANQNVGSDNPYFDDTPQPAASAHLPAQNVFDLSATWRMMDAYTVRFGVNNLLDRDPPLVGSLLGGTDARFNGNTYPVVYPSLGRFVFLGLTADF
jgi:iron complex outermembrane recepter protein